MKKRILPVWSRFVALAFTLCAVAWFLSAVWVFKYSRTKAFVRNNLDAGGTDQDEYKLHVFQSFESAKRTQTSEDGNDTTANPFSHKVPSTQMSGGHFQASLEKKNSEPLGAKWTLKDSVFTRANLTQKDSMFVGANWAKEGSDFQVREAQFEKKDSKLHVAKRTEEDSELPRAKQIKKGSEIREAKWRMEGFMLHWAEWTEEDSELRGARLARSERTEEDSELPGFKIKWTDDDTQRLEANRAKKDTVTQVIHGLDGPVQKPPLTTSSDASAPKVTTHDCSKIWDGEVDAEYLSMAANVTKNCSRESRDYRSLTSNCTRYVLDSGFRLATVSEEELSFPLAFSLLVYKDVEQVERLLRAIYRPHNVYCVHVDKKSDETFKSRLRLIVDCLPNVFLLPVSIDVQWGKFTVLEPELECMRSLWSHTTKWQYYINLTGQEFPLKTNKELVKILKTFNGANDIVGTHDEQFHFRWQKFLPAPYDLQISKGSVHVVVTRGFVDYVVNSWVSHDLQKWVRDTLIPDESFFSTLNHNPKLGVPGSYTGDLDKRNHTQSFARYKVWQFENKTLCSGRFVRWICHFGVGDLPRLVTSPQLFANKFSCDLQPLAYDCLEEWYFHKVLLENSGQPQPLDTSLYEHSDMVQNLYTGPVLIW